MQGGGTGAERAAEAVSGGKARGAPGGAATVGAQGPAREGSTTGTGRSQVRAAPPGRGGAGASRAIDGTTREGTAGARPGARSGGGGGLPECSLEACSGPAEPRPSPGGSGCGECAATLAVGRPSVPPLPGAANVAACAGSGADAPGSARRSSDAAGARGRGGAGVARGVAKGVGRSSPVAPRPSPGGGECGVSEPTPAMGGPTVPAPGGAANVAACTGSDATVAGRARRPSAAAGAGGRGGPGGTRGAAGGVGRNGAARAPELAAVAVGTEGPGSGAAREARTRAVSEERERCATSETEIAQCPVYPRRAGSEIRMPGTDCRGFPSSTSRVLSHA